MLCSTPELTARLFASEQARIMPQGLYASTGQTVFPPLDLSIWRILEVTHLPAASKTCPRRKGWLKVYSIFLPSEGLFLEKRTAILLAGADELVVDVHGKVVRATLRDKEAFDLSAGAAAAIDAHGYWLTAAHCVEALPLLIWTSDGVSTRWGQARVVWTAQDQGYDVALVHADVEPFGTLTWCPSPTDPGPVLCAGSGLGSNRFSAGRVTGAGGSTSPGIFTLIYNDAPLTPGDSGGPIIALDGQLVGIVTEGSLRTSGDRGASSTALHVEEAFVRRRIELDLESRTRVGADASAR